jgi:hypothetical protein
MLLSVIGFLEIAGDAQLAEREILWHLGEVSVSVGKATGKGA